MSFARVVTFSHLLQTIGRETMGSEDTVAYIEEEHPDNTDIQRSDCKIIPRTRIDSTRSASGMIIRIGKRLMHLNGY